MISSGKSGDTPKSKETEVKKMTDARRIAARHFKFLEKEILATPNLEDEEILIGACFNAYMAVAFMLKNLLMTNGLPASFTYQIKTLLKMCEGYELAFPKELTAYSMILNKWGTESLYELPFPADKEAVLAVYAILKKWQSAGAT
jgi:HEPN domain-containing protein